MTIHILFLYVKGREPFILSLETNQMTDRTPTVSVMPTPNQYPDNAGEKGRKEKKKQR